MSSETLPKTPRLSEEIEPSTSSTTLDDYYTHPVRHTCGNDFFMVHVFMPYHKNPNKYPQVALHFAIRGPLLDIKFGSLK